MTEQQYNQICIACDQILMEPVASFERVAIPWLHVLNEHPVNLGSYAPVFGLRPKDRFIKIKSFARIIFDILNNVKTPQGWHSTRETDSPIDVLFISHLVNVSHIGRDDDFYFGSLAESLIKAGLSAGILLHDSTGKSIQNISGRWSEQSAPRFIFNRSMSYSSELEIWQKLSYQARSLVKSIKNHRKNKFLGRVLRYAASQAMSSRAIRTLRFSLQLIRLIEVLKPRVLVVTYEGHAWERLAFYSARRVNQNIRCIGYQHTILFPRQHAISRCLGEKYDPNLIMTAGDITRSKLIKSIKYVQAVKTLGVHRYSSQNTCVLTKLENRQCISCLVLPDGTIEESIRLIKFTLDSAKILREIKFIIRLHPILSVNDIKKFDSALIQLPQNVEFSSADLDIDFSRSRWSLYRGSSAAIYGVGFGIRPFYISLPDELSIDPLYNLDKWKITIRAASELAVAINKDKQSNNDDLIREYALGREYCSKYFQKIDAEVLLQECRY